MSNYETIIGLEVHAQLKTRSKMFCSCATTFGAEPNTNICPICTAQPGVLPVINKASIDMAIRAGLACNCRINLRSEFSRKNYFYPDLPKGYQITQYDHPICEHGNLQIFYDGKENNISITRIHLEEDAGKSTHDLGHKDMSHVDFNRCGVPLIEIVSGPDMRSPEEGIAYLKTLRNVLVYLDVCDGNMQEGSFRCDANVSVRKFGAEKFGTRTELKNMNSFKAIEKALFYEIKRQTDLLEAGGVVRQETLLWDDKACKTFSMRSKEESHDYRYFPEPDLEPLVVDEKWIADIKAALPELANDKAKRFTAEFGIPEYDARVLTAEKATADYYESALEAHNSPKMISNWIMVELLAKLNADEVAICECKVKPEHLAKLVKMIEAETISGKIAKDVFADMYSTGADPEKIVSDRGLVQVTDTREIEEAIDKVISENPENAEKFRAGKVQLLGFFVGEVMKLTKGRASPKIVNEILRKKL